MSSQPQRPPDDIIEANQPAINRLVYANPSAGFSPYMTFGDIDRLAGIPGPQPPPQSRPGFRDEIGSSGQVPASYNYDNSKRFPVNPPKLRGGPPPPQGPRSPESKCPFCGSRLVTKCTCEFCVSTCEKGHKFYFHPVTHQPIPIPTNIQQTPPQNPPQQMPRETRVTQV